MKCLLASNACNGRIVGLTQAYNRALADTVNKIENATHLDLVLFDVFTFFNNIIKDSRIFLFINAKNACFSSVGVVFYPVCSNTQLDAFVYFDEIHPTRRVHERVGRAMFALIPLCVRIVVINSRNDLATIEYGCSPNPVVLLQRRRHFGRHTGRSALQIHQI
jgi:phospholipase/lecithinase/hemolysin